MAEKGNNTGLLTANGHRIQGRSSEDFLDVDEILMELKKSLSIKDNLRSGLL